MDPEISQFKEVPKFDSWKEYYAFWKRYFNSFPGSTFNIYTNGEKVTFAK